MSRPFAALLAAAVLAAGLPSDASAMGSKPSRKSRQAKKRAQAQEKYNAALALNDQARDLASTPGQMAKVLKLLAEAEPKLEEAVELDPNLYAAWSELGYAQRTLGNAHGALASYEKALALRPDYAPAIEYRGEAYLQLGRLEDAKQAYLFLFGRDQGAANKLAGHMVEFLQRPRRASDEEVADFRAWLEARNELAEMLRADGAATGW